MAQYSSQYLLS